MLVRFRDRSLRRAMHRQHADVVAAVEQDRERALALRAHRCARLAKPGAIGNAQNFRKPRVFIAAERRVDHMIGHDARFVGVEADPAERLLGQRASFARTQPIRSCETLSTCTPDQLEEP